MRPSERFLACLCLLLGLAGTAQAQPTSVQVVGLFPNAAVVLVDGQRKLVKVGQTGPGGVQVVSADNHGAVLRVDGSERRYELTREYNAVTSGLGGSSSRAQASIAKGAGGHFWVAGSIQGQGVQFLVDTGASAVAMNEGQARRLGIDYRVSGQPMRVSTASGTAGAWRITLNSVKVGAIEVLGVEAVVIQGDAPTEVLLGMSFLNRVRWREDQGVLLLESKT
ncbi:retropepsin-like aspartic protease family protein [Pseudomonas mangiferae]|uniref:TIGR02281 family clan AA aspartic protease n=1 Tax=Pseudomonas mangiferae TaxID=2593654 RepID=A0A553GUE6_9PSED|nr:TIGR02281 family clan AA aspartic protease [Pseudomonas mangiferae]TRX73101.1 TIGR02281 family clan AA aspartic protease [Pseudomonas mangiferae]